MDPISLETEPNRIPVTYWVLSLLIVLFVALCTGHRDMVWGSDSWEHHRVLKTLMEDPWHSANPTFATDEPSARYSPYMLGWALFGRATGLDPYRVLSMAGVTNTILMMLGVAALLKEFGAAACATAAVPIMMGLYGGRPGHSNSYALTDLPTQQVNPSAFCFATSLFVIAMFKRFERKGFLDFSLPLVVLLSAMSLLDHVISAVLGQFGIWLIVVTAKPKDRLRLAACAIGVGIAALALCRLWPLYDFVQLTKMKTPPGFVNIYIIWGILSEWTVPAMVASVVCLTLPAGSPGRVLALGGYGAYMLGMVTYWLPPTSPGAGAVSRLPLPGLILFHLALAVFAYQMGLFRLSTWPGRLKTLVSARSTAAAMPALEVAFMATLLYFLMPMFLHLFRSPSLLRPYVASIAGRALKYDSIKVKFDALMEPIGPRDVVLSDENSMWVVPSSKGRIVSALHPELFTRDQDVRQKDTETFFDTSTLDAERLRIIQKYKVQWIVLNEKYMKPNVMKAFRDEGSIVREGPGVVLMDADRWVKSRGIKPAAAASPAPLAK